MSVAFYIGCRVKVIAAQLGHENIVGTEGFICDSDWLDNWIVSLGPWRTPCAKWAAPMFLAPILPDGLESIEEIYALYEPSPEVVKA